MNLPVYGIQTKQKIIISEILFYNITGYAYRFAYIDDVYQWKRIIDKDVVTALANAQNAQDTADGKRTFI